VSRLCSALSANADRVVITDHSGTSTGAQLMSRALWSAHWLAGELDVGPGTVLAVTSANTTWGLALRYGANLLGATTCHLPFIGADRQDALIELINPSVVVSDGTGPMAGADAWNVIVAPVPSTPLETPRPDDFAAIRPYRDDDVCGLVASGGTTGIPKASYRSIRRYSAMVDIPTNRERRQLVVTPFAYIAASLIDETLSGEGSVILGEHTWHVDRVAETVSAETATHMFVVEPALADLVSAAGADVAVRRRLDSLQEIFHLGAGAPPGLRERARAVFGSVVTHGYAASELGPVSSTKGCDFDAHSAGRIIAGVRCRIVNHEGDEVPAGEAGTITLSSPWIANGYWNRQPGNEFSEWMHTTDEGTLSADGELAIAGRTGDYLGGTRVHASEVEATVSRVEGVDYVIVLPEPDVSSRTAFVVVQSPNAKVRSAVEEVTESFSDRLDLKVLVLDHIPRTEQGKPDRISLATLLQG
jgi:fatty-acyl-CoA synthase